LRFYHKKTFVKKKYKHIYFHYNFFYIHTTNYKNSKINKSYIKQFKITKQPQKNPGIAGKAFCTTGTVSGRLLEGKTVAARLLHAPPSLAGPMRRRKKSSQ
jgi:hypothetical protein